MAPVNKDLAKLLRLIADLSESDQPELVSYVYNSVRTARNNFEKRKKLEPETSERKKLEPETSEKLLTFSNDEISRLEQFENREDLSAYLKTTYQRRADVEAVARALEVPVTKSSNYDDIIEKIIDASIGYKLRSRAIRGE